MNNRSYHEPFDIEKMRADMKEHIAVSPRGVIRICADIGISNVTMSNFLLNRRNVGFITLCKMEKYLDNQDKIDKLQG